MYAYDDLDQQLVEERVAQFRDQTTRYLNGLLSEEQFKPLRLMNGLYLQRHAPMLRIAIPYGVLSSRQLRKLADISDQFDKSYGHFTTRQNLQLNWPEIADVPDILAQLASVQMHAIQTSGNCIRNVTTDHLAGVAPDELEDPRPWAELIRQWSTLHPEFSFLPRKFKIAISGAEKDRAATEVHDIGLQLVKNSAGNTGFKVLVGGGLGRTPIIGKVIRPFLHKPDLLSYLEAILRVYNRLGRRDNKYKARIKILVKETGIETFTQLVEQEWLRIRESALKLNPTEIDAIWSHFQPPNYPAIVHRELPELQSLSANPQYRNWLQHNTFAHKQRGYRAVMIALKNHGQAPGDMTADQMRAVAELADSVSFGQIRTTHTQNLLLADVPQNALANVYQSLHALNLASPVINTLADVICCPGLDFCSLANTRSIPIADAIHARFDDLDYLHDLGDIKLKMSGCMNACGHHHVGHIGILGVDKKGEEWFQITIGGSAESDARLGHRIGPAVPAENVVETIEKLIQVYVHEREDTEPFLDTVQRIGVQPFREGVYHD